MTMTANYAPKPNVLRCSRCGKFVDWVQARLQLVCDCRPHLDLPPVLTREADEAGHQAALELFRRNFGRTEILELGEIVSFASASTIIAEMGGELGGALAYRRVGNALHVMALATDPMWQRSGVGAYLLAEAEITARRQGCKQVIVVTTNDNLPALYFYQRKGYRITEVLPGAMLRHPSAAPMSGFAEIPVADEIRLAKILV